MKPIETLYGAYLFRSRLEARWAVFFNHCGVRYVYEHQGYRLPSGLYLPDFWLPHHNNFVEVKPINLLPTKSFEFGPDFEYQTPYGSVPIDDVFPQELNLAWELHRATNSFVVVAYGDPYHAIHDLTVVEASSKGLRASSVDGWFLFFEGDLWEAAKAARAGPFEHGEGI